MFYNLIITLINTYNKMNRIEFEALTKVINYIADDEQKHYEEGNFTDKHIWNDIKVLMDYAQAHQFTLQNFDDYCDEQYHITRKDEDDLPF